jgi:hypothetical protein
LQTFVHYHCGVIKEGILDTNQTGHPTQFPLRLAKSLREAATAVAKEHGISLNHFIAMAVAEKINRTEAQVESSPDGRHATSPIDLDKEPGARLGE